MLPRSQRLSKENFDLVYSSGTNLTSEVGYFKILSWDDGGERTKVSCVAAKKDSKKASERNQIRRRGYGAIEQVIGKLPSNGYGIIWFLPQETLSIDFSKLKKAAKIMINSLDDV